MSVGPFLGTGGRRGCCAAFDLLHRKSSARVLSLAASLILTFDQIHFQMLNPDIQGFLLISQVSFGTISGRQLNERLSHCWLIDFWYCPASRLLIMPKLLIIQDTVYARNFSTVCLRGNLLVVGSWEFSEAYFLTNKQANIHTYKPSLFFHAAVEHQKLPYKPGQLACSFSPGLRTLTGSRSLGSLR